MSQRTEALWRIWAFLWIAVVGYLLALVVTIVAIIWAPIDIVWQLLSGRDDLSTDRAPARAISATLSWSVGQTIYALTGGGDESWRPLPTS